MSKPAGYDNDQWVEEMRRAVEDEREARGGEFVVSFGTLFLGFMAATSLALVASLLPAIRASRVAVADELRRQG